MNTRRTMMRAICATSIVVTGMVFSVPTSQPLADYKLVWADEFDGQALDPSKWDYRGLGKRRDAVNVEDCLALDGEGHLLLTTKRAGGEYHAAMIGTQGKFEACYGYFECRVKMQTQPGHWSAFWLQSPTMGSPVGDPQAAGAEIDIFEYLAKRGDRIQHTLHWDGYGKDHRSAQRIAPVAGLRGGWHTIGLLWSPREYVFSVDGRETWRTNKAVSHRSEYIILSLEVGKWAGDIAEAQLPDHFYVDYVRVYQRPQDASKQSATPAQKAANRRWARRRLFRPFRALWFDSSTPRAYALGCSASPFQG